MGEISQAKEMLVGSTQAAWRSGQGAGQGVVPGGPSGVWLSHLIPRSAVNFSVCKVHAALGISDECSSLRHRVPARYLPLE